MCPQAGRRLAGEGAVGVRGRVGYFQDELGPGNRGPRGAGVTYGKQGSWGGGSGGIGGHCPEGYKPAKILPGNLENLG